MGRHHGVKVKKKQETTKRQKRFVIIIDGKFK